MFSQFLRRKKRSGSAAAAMGPSDVDESQESEDSMPPPTPPKDKGIYATMALPSSAERRGEREEREKAGEYAYVRFLFVPLLNENGMTDSHRDDSPHAHTPEREYEHEPLALAPGLATISESSLRNTRSVSEFAVVSHEEVGGRPSGGEVDVVVIRPEEFGRYGDKPLPPYGQPQRQQQQPQWGINTLKKGKWAEPQGLSAIRDPAERARLRMELQKQKEEEEKEMLRAEEMRQERIRREKAELMRREEEEAERRKAAIQAEALRVAAERRRREELERQEEERKARERQERKRIEKQKRIEEHLRLEEWRREQQRIAEETARMEEEARRKGEEERKSKILKAEDEVKQKAREGAMTGWVTIQTDDSVVWRRRYYKFAPNTFYFYRSPKVRVSFIAVRTWLMHGQDLTQTVDKLDVRGAVRALKEPKDGYEDLEAIPFSFAIEFHDRGAWSVFADSEEEKVG